ncbi:MAG: hypothetical protein WBX09_06375 [Terracidiphilus sp.]
MSRNTIKPTSALARRAVTSRQVGNPGVTKLRKDADDKVLEKSTEIAKALADEAVKGNASSARLLVDLADGANWTEHSDSVAKVISLAVTEWKKEPPVVQLEVTTNPPRLNPPEPRQLTDGNQEP